MLKTILSISGKPGLYKLVSHGKNMLIVESLTDNKRVPAYAKDKVISLGDIAIYTDETEVPLHEVLTSVKNKEEGKTASLVPSKATTDQLRAYFAEVLPSYDRERVYPSDIKKLLSWYNILINAGITDFTPEDAPAEKEAAEKEAPIRGALPQDVEMSALASPSHANGVKNPRLNPIPKLAPANALLAANAIAAIVPTIFFIMKKPRILFYEYK